MPKSKKKADLLPEEFQTIMEAAEFWDSHDLADYWADTREVSANIKVPPTPTKKSPNLLLKLRRGGIFPWKHWSICG